MKFFNKDNISFTEFEVPFGFIFKFRGQKEYDVFKYENGSNVPLFKITLPFELQKKVNSIYVYVMNLPNKDFCCRAASSINDPEVINFILRY
mgnify:CR=1 FL=1